FSNLLHSSGNFSINTFLSLAGARHPSLPVEGDFVNYVLQAHPLLASVSRRAGSALIKSG
ncbi:MAG: hypothetical protein ACLP7P_05635, partial [Rhodomicrobium sp.]